MVNLLESFDRVTDVKDAENGRELLTMIKFEQPDVAIVDLQMPVVDGTETCERLITGYPDVKIIVLTMHDSERYILHMMEMGVHAFLLKNTEPEELEAAINSVVDKDFYHNDLVAAVIRRNMKAAFASKRPEFKSSELSAREKEILMLICQELTIREISERLSISENTARNHRVNMMDKIGVKNMVGLVRHAYEIGLIK
jgi:DNA-binding NarL/FixJ family response regulator